MTVTASHKPLEPPELASPAGLEMSFAGGSTSTAILNGTLMMTTTFAYNVVPQRTGRFAMPSFEIVVGGGRVRVPGAVLTVMPPDPNAAPCPARACRAGIAAARFFTGESISGRLLVIETPDESPQFVSHVAKTTGAAVVRPSLRTTREQFTIGGQKHEGS